MTPNLAQTVPAALRAELARRDITRSNFADQLGHATTWLTRRLAGRTEITLADVDEICRGLDLEPVLEFRPVPPTQTTASRGAGRRSRTQSPSAEGNE